MLQPDMLSYIKLRKYLETDSFKFNPYDPIVVNNIIEIYPLALVFHVDEVKERHKYKKVVDSFEQWIDFIYGYPNIQKVKLVRGKANEYFSMNLYYTKKGEVKIDMQKYVKNVIDEFMINIEKA